VTAVVEEEAEGRPTRSVLDVLVFDLGATAQATVPGAYAWAVTVEPAAFVRGALVVSRVVAVCGLALLAFAPVLERKRPAAARIVSVWGLVATSLFVWVVAPTSFLAPSRADAVRGIAGMIGWALFALASCAPALPGRPRVDASSKEGTLRRRGDSGRLDVLILGVGIGLAALVQSVGWQTDVPERALLVRLVALSTGVMIVGASSSLVAARHLTRTPDAPARRAKRAILPLVLFGLLAVAGAVYTLAAGRG
jgi:hypothetical protein